MNLLLRFYTSILACSPGSDLEAFYKYLEENDRIGSYGIYVIIIAILIHLIVNKIVFKKYFTFSLIMYAFMLWMHWYLAHNQGGGDCGTMYRESTTYFAIMSAFWIIFAPLITHAIKKYRKFLKDKNSTKPFASPSGKFEDASEVKEK